MLRMLNSLKLIEEYQLQSALTELKQSGVKTVVLLTWIHDHFLNQHIFYLMFGEDESDDIFPLISRFRGMWGGLFSLPLLMTNSSKSPRQFCTLATSTKMAAVFIRSLMRYWCNTWQLTWQHTLTFLMNTEVTAVETDRPTFNVMCIFKGLLPAKSSSKYNRHFLITGLDYFLLCPQLRGLLN